MKNKNIKLNQEEKRINKDFEGGKFNQVKGIKKEKEKYQRYAKYTLSKPKSINIRLSVKDLNKIKAIAAEKGLPYQTFISSLLHQYLDKK